jgi:predicted aspartyl protease
VGTFKVPIEVGNAEGTRWERLEAYADSGAHFSSIPRPVWEALDLKPVRRVTFRMADGGTRDQDVGRGRLRVDGQDIDTSVILGDPASPCILGALAMEDLLLAPDPVRKRLVPIEPVMLTQLP